MKTSYRVHFLRGRGGFVSGINFIVGRWAFLGRGEKADIRIPDLSVSRLHAAICWGEGSGFVVADLESRNGVYVNGKAVQCCIVRSGDRLRFGLSEFEFLPAARPTGAAKESHRVWRPPVESRVRLSM